jgi:hypothetical protein
LIKGFKENSSKHASELSKDEEEFLESIPMVTSTISDSKSSSNFDNSDSKTNRSNSSSDNKKTSNKIQKSGGISSIHSTNVLHSTSNDSKPDNFQPSKFSGKNQLLLSSLTTTSPRQVASINANKTSIPLKSTITSKPQVEPAQKSEGFQSLTDSCSEVGLDNTMKNKFSADYKFSDVDFSRDKNSLSGEFSTHLNDIIGQNDNLLTKPSKSSHEE